MRAFRDIRDGQDKQDPFATRLRRVGGQALEVLFVLEVLLFAIVSFLEWLFSLRDDAAKCVIISVDNN